MKLSARSMPLKMAGQGARLGRASVSTIHVHPPVIGAADICDPFKVINDAEVGRTACANDREDPSRSALSSCATNAVRSSPVSRDLPGTA